jgi:hypothetical protein
VLFADIFTLPGDGNREASCDSVTAKLACNTTWGGS